MSKRGKSERRDGEKCPKTPTKKKSNPLLSSRDAKKLVGRRWNNKRSNGGRFGSEQRMSVQKPRKEDIETTSETKPYRYVTPQKKKRDESISTSNQTTSSEKVSPPRKRVNKERTNVQKVATQKNVSLTLSHSKRETVHTLFESLKLSSCLALSS